LPGVFQPPSVGWDAGRSARFVAGTGSRSCGWYDCPYLPEELKANCSECNYNVATGEGCRGVCGEPPGCQRAAEGRQQAENARRLQAQQR
jgi:hypothetical protein